MAINSIIVSIVK